ncbi:hypothetical protein J2S43_003905 [Catenuloplanes nepalensis]|uniref:AAA+ ATPase domain-containing protein n=1 Tax=Catenuloplanes nepalensis TaxID=587533 RepID=A0ABT9MVY4_9ACTN|nr:AAA family ATPase [Catenuloplanes nepalensis]MDP9795393.1 hypothetical protein [Catenuloplanes nepalensis]
METTQTLGAWMSRGDGHVGRAVELRCFREALDGTGEPVIFVHGPGGMGKSTLLRRMAADARGRGRTVIRIDGRDVESPARFEAEAAGALADPRAVLLVDTFERCRGLEAWLTARFLPRLPDGALVVLAGRRPPQPRHWSDPGWSAAMRALPLHDLPPADATALLRLHGVPPERCAALLNFAGGHPLALRLAAEVARARATPDEAWTPHRDVVGVLLGRLVGELPSTVHRRALEVCAHAMATTEELLRAAVGDDAATMFEWLRRQPYIESGKHGLRPHDLVRDLLETDLRWRDRAGYDAMQARVRKHLLARVRRASGPAELPALAALTYQHRRHAMPGWVTWRDEADVHEDTAGPDDHDAIIAFARRAEGPESAEIARYWLARQPAGFRVHRLPSGEPRGFMAWLRLTAPDPADLAADPVVAAAWAHVRAAGPLRAGEHLGVARFTIDPTGYQRPSPVTDLVQLRVCAHCVREERLGWSFVVIADRAFWTPLMTYLDQHPIPAEPRVDGHGYTLFGHDWRAMPVDAWFARNTQQMRLGPALPPAGNDLVVLSRDDFDTAVREALRQLRHPSALTASPLRRTRLAVSAPLHDVLRAAIDAIGRDPRLAKAHRAVAATFLHGAPTQEIAAAQLHLPLSTYRRHLAAGIEAVCAHLWALELRDSPGHAGARD